MPPKIRKGESKKAPVTGGLVNDRMPEDGPIEANELLQRPEFPHGPEMSYPVVIPVLTSWTNINGGPKVGIPEQWPRVGEGAGINLT